MIIVFAFFLKLAYLALKMLLLSFSVSRFSSLTLSKYDSILFVILVTATFITLST